MKITQMMIEEHYTDVDQFTAEQGFFLAFNFDLRDGPLPPQVGNLQLIEWARGIDENTGYWVEENEIETDFCTPEEVGVIESEERRMFNWDNAPSERKFKRDYS